MGRLTYKRRLRFAFLATNCSTFNTRMKFLADALLSQNSSVKVFICMGTPSATGHEIHMDGWDKFDLVRLIKYDPHLIIIWNGYYPEIHAATYYLKRKFRTATMELGWYPQKNYNYLSNDLAQISAISKIVYTKGIAQKHPNQKLLEETRSSYNTKIPNGLDLPKSFIFIPRQYEQDTQILSTSSQFKTMYSLFGYVRYINPGKPILVTNHPIDKHKTNPDFVIDMTDKAPSLALALKSEKVIGINSTVLSETMLFKKQTMCLGEHVAKLTIGEENSERYDIDEYEFRSLILIYNQWDVKNPPGWLIDKLNSLDLSPRIPS